MVDKKALPSHHARRSPNMDIRAKSKPSARQANVTPKKTQTRPPHSDLQLQLISDIGPELVQRWCENSSFETTTGKAIPAMFRSLLSYVLRSASYEEADKYMTSYQTLRRKAVPSTGAILGFTSQMDSHQRTTIWHDLFYSTWRDEELSPHGPALEFYSTAGAGADDSAEYKKAGIDCRIDDFVLSDSHTFRQLADVRSYARSLVIQHAFAYALRNKKCGNLVAECTERFGARGFAAPFFEYLPKHIDSLPSHASLSLYQFYDALYQSLSVSQHSEFNNRLISSILSLAFEKPSNVFKFLTGLPDKSLRLAVVRRCLSHRFGEPDANAGRPLTWNDILRRLRNIVKLPVPGRPNQALPAFLAILLSTWSAVTDDSTINISSSDMSVELPTLESLKYVDWSAFEAPQQDIKAYKIAVHEFTCTLLDAIIVEPQI